MPKQVYEFLRELGSCESAEHMYALLMDTKRKVNGVYMVGKGSIDGCDVDPKKIYKAALVSNRPAFTVVHNHPSGMVEPSPEDIALVESIDRGANTVGLEFTDNMIFTEQTCLSLYELGRMPKQRR